MDESEELVPCDQCGNLYPADELVDGVCPDCLELMETEMELEDEELYLNY
jgi:NMD protein affecting ribosome stability and mRNA decay